MTQLRLVAGFVICFLLSTASAIAGVTITGTTVDHTFVITGMSVSTRHTPTVFKITLTNKTPLTRIILCAGSLTDQHANRCPMQLSHADTILDPEHAVLTIVESNAIEGMHIWVVHLVNQADTPSPQAEEASFVFTLE